MMTKVLVCIISGVFGLLGIYLAFYLNNKRKWRRGNAPLYLKNHPFCARINFLLNKLNLSFDMEDKGRMLLIKLLLKNNFNIWKNNMMEMADIIDVKTKHKEDFDLLSLEIKYFNKAVKEFNNFFLNGDYSKEDRKVLTLTLKIFNDWHAPRLEYLQNAIDWTCNSLFFKDNIVRAAVILDLYIGILIDTVTDAEKTLKDINGKLKGLIFKGYKL